MCCHISTAYSSGRDLSDAVIDSILRHKDDRSKLPSWKVAILAEALYYPSRKIFRNNDYGNLRRDCLRRIKCFRNVSSLEHQGLQDIFTQLEKMSKSSLMSVAHSHGSDCNTKNSVEELKDWIVNHFVHGRCMRQADLDESTTATSSNSDVNACGDAVTAFFAPTGIPAQPELFHLFAVSEGIEKIQLRAARRLLSALGLPFDPADNVPRLRRTLKAWLKTTLKGKLRDADAADGVNDLESMVATRLDWPQTVTDSVKQKVRCLFREVTSKDALASVTCASCGLHTLEKESKIIELADIDLRNLTRPDVFTGEASLSPQQRWLDADVLPPPMPFSSGPLKDVLVDPSGVSICDGQATNLVLCKECLSALNRDEIPSLALANRLYIGPVPPELQDLTVVEEAMIARCRAQCWVVQLKEDSQDIVVTTSQHGMKGHVIIYPQNPSAVAESLPPSLDEITAPICVIFVGASQPSEEWIREKAKPLAVRGTKVRTALNWLKRHNRYYKDIRINEDVLSSLESNPVLPFHVEHVLPSEHAAELTSRYDHTERSNEGTDLNDKPVVFENVVITDVDGNATTNQLRSAAFRHVKQKGKGYLQIARDSHPVDEFDNPAMLPMCYPTLFPYGLGGCDDPDREVKVSLKRHVKHLFSSGDRRFQTHYSFLFTVFNIIQRREMLLRTALKTKKENFSSIASRFAGVSTEAIHVVSERASRGDLVTANSDEEKKVLLLMNEVKAVTAPVPGSAASKTTMRNEIRALIVNQGLPHFYVTINPADVYNPLVCFLAGSDINVDTCIPSDFDYHQQAYLVAKNPAAAAKFFNVYMNAFIHAVLGYNSSEKKKVSEGGILGKVKAYYGTVEAQGRGTLHCHMMIWVEGGMNPDDIKKKIFDEGNDDFKHRLFSFLDDTIHTKIPDDPDPNIPSYHPCCV